MMSVNGPSNELCTRRFLGLTTLTRFGMRLAGYPESTPPIDAARVGKTALKFSDVSVWART